MNEQYFQVNVERATPACDANCPNLQIDVDDVNCREDGALIQKRVIRCVNNTWCQQLYVGMEKKLKNS